MIPTEHDPLLQAEYENRDAEAAVQMLPRIPPTPLPIPSHRYGLIAFIARGAQAGGCICSKLNDVPGDLCTDLIQVILTSFRR